MRANKVLPLAGLTGHPDARLSGLSAVVARNVSAMGVGNHVFTIVWSADLVIHLDSTAVMSSCIFAFAFANRRNLASGLMLPIAARRYSFCLATAAISPEFGPIADGYEAVDHRRELFEDELGSVYSCQKAAVHVQDR